MEEETPTGSSSKDSFLYPEESIKDERKEALFYKYRYYLPFIVVILIISVIVLAFNFGENTSELLAIIFITTFFGLAILFVFSFVPLISDVFDSIDKDHISNASIEFEEAKSEPDLDGLDDFAHLKEEAWCYTTFNQEMLGVLQLTGKSDILVFPTIKNYTVSGTRLISKRRGYLLSVDGRGRPQLIDSGR